MRYEEIVRGVVTETDVAITNVSGAFVPANLLRLALYLPSDGAIDITYSTDGAAIAGQGVFVPHNTAGVWLLFADHGPLVQKAFAAIASAAGPTTKTYLEVNRAE